MSVHENQQDTTDAINDLESAAALARLSERSTERAIYRAHLAGLSEQDMVEHLNIPQSEIHRKLRRLENHPNSREDKPGDVIDRRTAGLISTEHMMEILSNWKFTFGRVPCINGIAVDYSTSGTWDEVDHARYRRRLTSEEFNELTLLNKAGLDESMRRE